ncbi:MAG TPA: adenylate/guanylate cyclase domain-containing protein [Candidatus Cybelea sp.]|nr:adenylate/guanylate cyclase domain-containing protein [Candidatus Cybelea sp.]
MICPGCKAENRPGRRFCAACGQALPLACPACGFENATDDRFCGGCGRALDQSSPEPSARQAALPQKAEAIPPGDIPPGEIRPVTVMFADISGYTELSARLDPEDTHRLLAQFFETVDEIVIRFGGRIDKHIGDSVMAVFGAPVAHGNDPERAVVAAVAVHEAMPALATRLGQVLHVHIGIATGEVVASGLGSSAHSAYTVIGDAVNLAARLMEHARASETLVSAAVWQASEAALSPRGVGAVALGPVPLKGIAAPVETLRISASEPAALAPAPKQGQRPLTGRRAELAQLSALLESALEATAGSAVVLRGEPGIGKSRLADELSSLAGQRGFTVLKALVLDFGAARERSVERVLAGGMLAAISGTPEAAEHALDQAGIDAADRPYLRDLLDLPQPEESRATYEAMSNASRNRGKSAVLARLAARAARGRALFLLIEDVHWADAVTLAHLAALAEASGRDRLMLAMTTRIEGDPFDATFRAGLHHGHLTVIDLAPLGAAEAEVLAHAIRVEMDDFARRCIERAEGNPLFLEQLLRGAAGPDRLPQSLQSVVLARLDQLTPPDRHALQAASVLGQRFEVADLATLINHRGYDSGELLRRQLVRPEGSGFLFAHALIRDGAYASLTRDRRTALHQAAAALFKDRDAALHAEHLDRAEDPAAARAYLAAAQAEAAAYRVDRARSLAERGLEIARSLQDRVALGLAAGRFGLDIGLGKSARAAFQVAAEAEAPEDRCRALIGLAAADRMVADIPNAMANLEAAEPIATALDDPALLAEICYQRGNLNFALGNAEECLAQHRRALAAAKRSGVAEWKARARSGLGDAYYMQGKFRSSSRQFLRAVEIAKENRLIRIVGVNQAMAGNTLFYTLDIPGALSMIEQSRRLAIEIGDRFGEMFANECRAVVFTLLRRWEELDPPLTRALEMARELGTRRYVSILLPLLALRQHFIGQHEEAEAAVREAMAISDETGPGFCGPIVCSVASLVERDPARRRAAFDKGEALLRQTGLSHNHIWFRFYAIDWTLQDGDWMEAERQLSHLAQYTAAEPLPFVDLMIDRGRALVRLGRDPEDRAAAEQLRRIEARAVAAGCGEGITAVTV